MRPRAKNKRPGDAPDASEHQRVQNETGSRPEAAVTIEAGSSPEIEKAEELWAKLKVTTADKKVPEGRSRRVRKDGHDRCNRGTPQRGIKRRCRCPAT